MRIGIIGFGLSGAMVAAELVRNTAAPLTLYIVDEKHDARGVAYATDNPDHLLNVRAGNMSAFAEDKKHLLHWLTSDAGKAAAAARGLGNYAATDFIPRALYGDYLQGIWREAQEIAAHKNCSIKLVPSRAVAIQNGATPAILTQRGDAIAVDKIVLAVGHEIKPVLPNVASGHIIQNPWDAGVFADAARWPSPVMLIGTGLTAVDMLLSLRRAGYAGEVVAASFSGCLPQPHAETTAVFSFRSEEIAALKTLPQMLKLLRTKIRAVGDWRVVIDALRPHTQALWQRLSTREQQHFLTRLTTRWITHRHRMAPEITARVNAEIAAGTFRLIGCKQIDARVENGALAVTVVSKNAAQQIAPSRVLNCAGLELNLARSSNPLLRQMLADGLVEPHATTIGIVADMHGRAWGALHPNLYVLGSLLTGQLLESTAVPELRVQAAEVAKNLIQEA